MPHCPDPATKGGRCASHARKRERAPGGRKIYNRAKWRNTRDRYLSENPLCQHPDCEEIATDVHHRDDLADGGDPWAWENLEGLCHSHHSIETRRRQRQPDRSTPST